MRIVSVETLEDCFEGSATLGYRFDEAWTRESIARLRGLGELDYFPDFPRPFFRLRMADGMQVKGIEGESDCRAILPREEKEKCRRRFEALFDG